MLILVTISRVPLEKVCNSKTFMLMSTLNIKACLQPLSKRFLCSTFSRFKHFQALCCFGLMSPPRSPPLWWTHREVFWGLAYYGRAGRTRSIERSMLAARCTTPSYKCYHVILPIPFWPWFWFCALSLFFRVFCCSLKLSR